MQHLIGPACSPAISCDVTVLMGRFVSLKLRGGTLRTLKESSSIDLLPDGFQSTWGRLSPTGFSRFHGWMATLTSSDRFKGFGFNLGTF